MSSAFHAINLRYQGAPSDNQSDPCQNCCKQYIPKCGFVLGIEGRALGENGQVRVDLSPLDPSQCHPTLHIYNRCSGYWTEYAPRGFDSRGYPILYFDVSVTATLKLNGGSIFSVTFTTMFLGQYEPFGIPGLESDEYLDVPFTFPATFDFEMTDDSNAGAQWQVIPWIDINAAG